MNTTPSYGLSGYEGAPQTMREAHQHDDLELNWLERGTVTYFFAGRLVTVQAGQLAVLWGAVPHRLLEVSTDARFIWLTVPLARFLTWNLPSELPDALLGGHMVLERDPARSSADGLSLKCWLADINHPERHVPLLLEYRARLHRLALSLNTQYEIAEVTLEHDDDAATRLAHHLRQHYTESLSLSGAARALGLHPNYASTRFRERFGLTPGEYLVRQRLVHAQRLLLTSDLGVLQIALESGFGSSSRFYAAFATLRTVPLEYRRRLRSAG